MSRAGSTGRGLPPVNIRLPPAYPPSWFDTFTALVDRLPGPAWLFYLILSASVIIAGTVVQWAEGAYPFGTFLPWHIWLFGGFCYSLGLMHYLDKSAARALMSFRRLLFPAIGQGTPARKYEARYARLYHELTTLPRRPALAATITGAALVIVVHALQTASGGTPLYLAGTAGTTLSTTFVLITFIPANALAILLLYHTLHQLSVVSRIYSHEARIDIYDLDPLYALSVPGAITAIGLTVYPYVFWVLLPVARSASTLESLALVIFVLVIFPAVAAATFVLPLLGAHRRLVAEKRKQLFEVSSRFKSTAQELHRKLDSHALLQMDHFNKALASLEIEQIALRRIPTWPWDPGAVRGLLTAILLPITIWLLQLLLGRVLGT